MKCNLKFITGVSILTLLTHVSTAHAVSVGDMMIGPGDVFLSTKTPVAGKTTRVYCTVHNTGQKDALASVRFTDVTTGDQIGGDQPISLIAGKTDDVFVDWKPVQGSYEILVEIIPWDTSNDDPNNNRTTFHTYIDADFDGDGVGNNADIDDDNDGVSDVDDPFPHNALESRDTDDDGIGDNADTDDDADTYLDSVDAFPQDANEHLDTDGDDIGDTTDADDDNDTISDVVEDKNGNKLQDNGETNPLLSDSDSDGFNDKNDAFPLNSNESTDFDKDGIGDNTDSDDDGDGINDNADTNSNNLGPTIVVSSSGTSLSVGGSLNIDVSESDDTDGKIVETIIIIQKIEDESSSESGSGAEAKSNSQSGSSADAGSNSQEGSNIGTEGSGEGSDQSEASSESTGITGASTADSSTVTNVGVSNQDDESIATTPNSTTSTTDANFLINYDEDALIDLNSVGDIFLYYFDEDGNIVVLEANKIPPKNWTLINNSEVMAFRGKTLSGNLIEDGEYSVSIVAIDNKGESRVEEMVVKVRTKAQIVLDIVWLIAVCLALLLGVQYIFRALKHRVKGKVKFTAKKGNKK